MAERIGPHSLRRRRRAVTATASAGRRRTLDPLAQSNREGTTMTDQPDSSDEQPPAFIDNGARLDVVFVLNEVAGNVAIAAWLLRASEQLLVRRANVPEVVRVLEQVRQARAMSERVVGEARIAIWLLDDLEGASAS